MILFLYISIMISTTMLTLNHPVSMGLALMLQTILMTLIIGIYNQTFWFSYILFLVFVGGLLVLFTYVASLASNEMFKFSPKFMILLSSIPLTMLISYLIDFTNLPTKFLLSEATHNNNPSSSMYLTTLSKFYNLNVAPTTILLVSYLLLTLIVVVKITQINEGPLRPSKM
uniref:NADH-ubiquinone oxidoreductase chain 6 n=1 Tax=Nesomachilis australica TaxID=299218 RepID=Q5C843_9INSE|nr:NADH dehydrogenase subunit 6 [Nesomachilis australica]AAV50273.1 NADH dehydrogenase subunit 6 [Nesomachilis australica]